MHVVELSDPSSLERRTHPWHGSIANPEHRHYDLRAQPELIRTALEDWRDWEHYPATETFYRLLEWVNGPESHLESSDCAFSAPAANETAGFDKALQCSARVMLLFRDLPQNADQAQLHHLTHSVARALSEEEEAFAWGVIGVTIVPVQFLELPGTEEDQLGAQLMLSLWAWGDTESETLANLNRALVALTTAIQRVDA